MPDQEPAFRIAAGTDGGPIGRVADRMKVDAIFGLPEDAPVTLPFYEDLLGRVRTTAPRQIFQAQWGFNGQPLSWSNQTTGAGTIEGPEITGHNFIKLTTSPASGDKIVYQTKRYWRYQPSRTHTVTFAVGFREGKINSRKRVGQFDDGIDGWYLQQNGDNEIEFVVASTASGSQTEVVIPRSSWNFDKVDGTGPSGLNLTKEDLQKIRVWEISFVWYGASVVQFAFTDGQRLVVLHREKFSGVYLDRPFTKTAFLPLRLEIENVGAVSGGSNMTVGSISFDIENGEAVEFGYQFDVSNKVNSRLINSNTTPTYLLAVRPKLTVNGIANRGVIIPNNIELLSTDDLYLETVVGGQATGGTWTDNGSNSISEYSENITGYTGGRVIRSGYIAAGGGRASGALATSFPGDLFVSIDSLLGNQDAVALRAYKLFGNSSAWASIGFREVY